MTLSWKHTAEIALQSSTQTRFVCIKLSTGEVRNAPRESPSPWLSMNELLFITSKYGKSKKRNLLFEAATLGTKIFAAD